MAKSTATKNESATAAASLKTGNKLSSGVKAGVKAKTAKLVKPAEADKAVKAPKEKAEGGRRGRVGTDLNYTVASKENPFREGTIRHDLWSHIKASKSTAAARALDSRISSAFMQDLADKKVIKFS